MKLSDEDFDVMNDVHAVRTGTPVIDCEASIRVTALDHEENDVMMLDAEPFAN